MNEPPKNTLGCNLLFIGVLQPNCRITLDYALFFEAGLRQYNLIHYISDLQKQCKRGVSECLSDV